MKSKVILILIIVITGLYSVTWGLKSTFHLSEKSYPLERQKALVENLKELILYKHVLDLLLTKQKEALERLKSAKNETERKYWTLMVLKYESLKLYCLTESLERILNIQNLNTNERNENLETLRYVQGLRKFMIRLSLFNTVQLETIETIEKIGHLQRSGNFRDRETGFEIWARLTKHHRILVHDFSKLTEKRRFYENDDQPKV